MKKTRSPLLIFLSELDSFIRSYCRLSHASISQLMYSQNPECGQFALVHFYSQRVIKIASYLNLVVCLRIVCIEYWSCACRAQSDTVQLASSIQRYSTSSIERIWNDVTYLEAWSFLEGQTWTLQNICSPSSNGFCPHKIFLSKKKKARRTYKKALHISCIVYWGGAVRSYTGQECVCWYEFWWN